MFRLKFKFILLCLFYSSRT